MNPAIEKFIEEMTTILKSGKDFVVEQAPDIFKQVLHYKLAVSITWVVILIFGFSACWKIHKWIMEEDEGFSVLNDRFGGYIVIGIFGVIGGVGLICNLDTVFEILFAPKIYLIEYFSGLVRSCGK